MHCTNVSRGILYVIKKIELNSLRTDGADDPVRVGGDGGADARESREGAAIAPGDDSDDNVANEHGTATVAVTRVGGC